MAGKDIWEGCTAQGESKDVKEPVYLEAGVWFIEIIEQSASNLGSATVRIQTTSDTQHGDWKDEADLTALDTNTKGEMMRGGRWVNAIVETANPSGAIDIRASKASA